MKHTIRNTMEHALLPNPASVSFEFFPPKTEAMEERLWEAITILAPLNPSFVSVTYGAGGSTRERTHQTVRRIIDETALKPAAHLTCVGASIAEIDEVVEDYWQSGVRHIVALRGDAPEQAGMYQPHPQGYAYAADLVAGLRKRHDFEISVAAYPEGHPQATSLDADIDNLKRKIDAGATRAITQYFFDTEVFLRFQDKLEKHGIDVPVVPGLLPVTNLEQLIKFSAMCGATVPEWLPRLFEGLEDDPRTREHVAVAQAAEQCRQLREKAGVEHFHFYTLNRAELVRSICHLLGIRP